MGPILAVRCHSSLLYGSVGLQFYFAFSKDLIVVWFPAFCQLDVQKCSFTMYVRTLSIVNVVIIRDITA